MPFWESENAYEGHLLEPPPDFDFNEGISEEDLDMSPIDNMNRDEIEWECQMKQVSSSALQL